MTIRIMLADDHAILRDGIRILLESQALFQVVGAVGDGATAVRLAAELQPDVVLMDISMPDLNGIEATRRIVATCPATRVIALSVHTSRNFVSEMFKAGASAYLPKSAGGSELATAIRTVVKGQVYLSPEVTGAFVESLIREKPIEAKSTFSELTSREREVLQLVAEGRTTKDIAALLHLSAKTVESYRAQIMNKLGVHTVAGLTKFAVRDGLTSPEP
jgi:DNA-binding NarL/FixJ family response regulator